MKQFFVLLILLLTFSIHSVAQLPFEKEILAYKQQDSVSMPPKNAILFVGSSSIRLWKNADEMFPGYTIINRGFGGSTLLDLNRYLPDIVFPYEPKQIVIYSGENDFAGAEISPDELFNRFRNVFQLIRNRFSTVSILYISMKPSPSRDHQRHLQIAANRRIRDFMRKKRNATYVDVFTPMLNSDGKPKPELFLADELHMNQQGYDIWKTALLPHLKK